MTLPQRIAVVSDVHGNLPALESALAEIDRYHPDVVTHAGDMINGPFSREVLDLLDDRGIRGVVGNHESYIIDVGRADTSADLLSDRFAPARWTLGTLSADHLREIESWPLEMWPHPELAVLHGTRDDLRKAVRASMSDEEVRRLYLDVDAQVIVSGHTHIPHTRSIDGKLIVNAGSTGVPILGEPVATYLLLTRNATSWTGELHSVTYDTDRVLRQAREGGWLATGGVAATATHEMISGERWSSPFMEWWDSEVPNASPIDAYRLFARNRGIDPLI